MTARQYSTVAAVSEWRMVAGGIIVRHTINADCEDVLHELLRTVNSEVSYPTMFLCL